MKPIETIATARTPDGSEMTLTRHDGDYAISVDRDVLMTSRQHESELDLARFGCGRVASHRNPRIMIGGLGLGYTLRQVLDMVSDQARVVVSELMPDVVRWNRDYLGELTGHPLRDRRVEVKRGDVVDLIQASPETFDAILLDVDNGPEAMTTAGNNRLYSKAGVQLCMRALHAKGCLAIWAAHLERTFERRVNKAGFHARYFRVPSYKGGKATSRCIWLVVREKRLLPDLAAIDASTAEDVAEMQGGA